MNDTQTTYSKSYSDSPQSINVALIGAGVQGSRLFDIMFTMPGVHVKAVCDIWQCNWGRILHVFDKYGSRFPDKLNVNVYDDFNEMLSEENALDAVIIATPDFCHEEQTVACLNAGLHVYCEQPMSNTVEGARNMLKAQKRTGKLLQIGYQRRSNPRYIYGKQVLLDRVKLLGRITAANSQSNKDMKNDRYAPNEYSLSKDILSKNGYQNMHQFMNWRWFDGLGAGPFADLASQQIDIFNWFFDKTPTSVTANGGMDYFEDKTTHQWPDTVMAVLDYDTKQGKVMASSKVIAHSSLFNRFETFMGDAGTLNLFESGKGGIYAERYQSQSSQRLWVKLCREKIVDLPPMIEEQYYIEDEDFINADFSIPCDSHNEGDLFLDWRISLNPSERPKRFVLPLEFTERPHAPHLRNFFNAVRGGEELNCPGQAGFCDDGYCG